MTDKKSVRLKNSEINYIYNLIRAQHKPIDLRLLKKLNIARLTKPEIIDKAEFDRLTRG